MESSQREREEVEPELRAVDVLEYARILLRRKWTVLSVLALVVASGGLYALRQPKIYRASASVIIDPNPPRYLDNQVGEVSDTGPGHYWMMKEYSETQFKVITSRKVAERVVDKLGLRHNEAFLGLDKVRDEALRKVLREELDPVAMVQGKVKVQPEKDSRLAHVVVLDLDADRAALLANAIAQAFIDENLSLKEQLTESASEWLEDQLVKLSDRARHSEVSLYDFKREADILSTSLEDRLNMVSQRLTALNAGMTEVKLKIAGLQARVAGIAELRKTIDEDASKWADVLEVPLSQRELIMRLKVSYVDARVQCAELRERYLEHHPKLLGCEEKLKVASEALHRELRNIVLAQETELAEAVRKERNLDELFRLAKAEAFEVNKRQLEHDRLKREADNDQRLFDLVARRLKDIELSGMLRTSNARILDKALPNPRPVKPRISVILALSLALGLFAGVGAALLRDWLDDTLVLGRDVEERLGIPFLGMVPIIPEPAAGSRKELYIHDHPKSSVAEHCRAVRTNLLFMSPDRVFKKMVVTSSGPEEGKSTTAINLGIAMAQSGSRVLLVDTDLRRPRLHKALGLPNDLGVSSLVVGDQRLDQAIKSTDVANLFVMTSGPTPPNPAELLHTASFKELLALLSERFDLIILDSPPVGAVADALVLAVAADGVLLVLKGGSTRTEQARRALRGLQDVNARIFGGVLNSVNVEDRRYGGYYAEYRRYGYYYGERPDQVAS